jgi:hypothetical protein
MMYAAVPDAPSPAVSLAAGPASLREEPLHASKVPARALAVPWSSKELVLRHRRLFGTAGIFCAGAAFDASLTSASTWIGVAAATFGLVLLLEGCVLAFPRPARSSRPESSVPTPPEGARL